MLHIPAAPLRLRATAPTRPALHVNLSITSLAPTRYDTAAAACAASTSTRQADQASSRGPPCGKHRHQESSRRLPRCSPASQLSKVAQQQKMGACNDARAPHPLCSHPLCPHRVLTAHPPCTYLSRERAPQLQQACHLGSARGLHMCVNGPQAGAVGLHILAAVRSTLRARVRPCVRVKIAYMCMCVRACGVHVQVRSGQWQACTPWLLCALQCTLLSNLP